jgi:hypothetical protein
MRLIFPGGCLLRFCVSFSDTDVNNSEILKRENCQARIQSCFGSLLAEIQAWGSKIRSLSDHCGVRRRSDALRGATGGQFQFQNPDMQGNTSRSTL